MKMPLFGSESFSEERWKEWNKTKPNNNNESSPRTAAVALEFLVFGTAYLLSLVELFQVENQMKQNDDEEGNESLPPWFECPGKSKSSTAKPKKAEINSFFLREEK